MEENFDNIDELDQYIADAQEKLIHQALAGKEGYGRYLKENQIPVRFGDLAIGESFSFARLGAFDKSVQNWRSGRMDKDQAKEQCY